MVSECALQAAERHKKSSLVVSDCVLKAHERQGGDGMVSNVGE